MAPLVPLSQADYENWLTTSIEKYAQEKVRAANWPAGAALRQAQEEFRSLLANGLATEGHYLLSVEDEKSGQKVGMVWLAIRDAERGRAFIFDIRILEPFRRRGYGLQALRALDELANELGMKEIGLHVFGHNLAARTLYEKAGYETTNVSMVRKSVYSLHDQGLRTSSRKETTSCPGI